MSIRKRIVIAASVAAMFASSYSVFAGEAPAKKDKGILVNPAGMTLYVFDKDEARSGKSMCNEKCAGAWPPFTAPGDAKASGDYSVVTRDDGSKQ